MTPKLSIDGPRWASLRADGTFAACRSSAAPTRCRSARRLAGQIATTTIRVPVVAASQPLTSKLNVMSYNTWHAGTRVYQGQMKEIRGYLLSDVDAVGMQEAGTAETQSLADRLGWSWYQGDGDTAVISRYPIIDTAEAGEGGTVAGARISVDPKHGSLCGCSPATSTTPSTGPTSPKRDGRPKTSSPTSSTPPRVLGPWRCRPTWLRSRPPPRTTASPVILTGDFNVPSHLDWTAATASTHFDRVVDWPATHFVQDAGFVDSFRTVHPDPAAVPGNTWSPLYPRRDGATGVIEPQDRIDFVFVKAPG